MTASLFRARSTIVWLGLVIVTLVSFTVGADHGIGSGVALWVLALALIKVRYVGMDFMELRDAPLLLRGASKPIASLCGSYSPECTCGSDRLAVAAVGIVVLCVSATWRQTSAQHT